MAMRWSVILLSGLTLAGCGKLQQLSEIGRPPAMTKSSDPTKEPDYRPMTMPMPKPQAAPNEANALWRQGSRAFFKDQRAAQVGDIITVVVSMTDSAKLNNVTTTTRTSGEQAGIPGLRRPDQPAGPDIDHRSVETHFAQQFEQQHRQWPDPAQ